MIEAEFHYKHVTYNKNYMYRDDREIYKQIFRRIIVGNYYYLINYNNKIIHIFTVNSTLTINSANSFIFSLLE